MRAVDAFASVGAEVKALSGKSTEGRPERTEETVSMQNFSWTEE